MSPLPRFARKETRQLAEELLAAGFIYTADDTKGHARFEHPGGIVASLSETPGHGQIRRVRALIRRATGDRGPKRDAAAVEARRRQEAVKQGAVRAAAVRARAAQLARADAERRLIARERELRELKALMGARGSI